MGKYIDLTGLSRFLAKCKELFLSKTDAGATYATKSEVGAKYTKPSGGIPALDLQPALRDAVNAAVNLTSNIKPAGGSGVAINSSDGAYLPPSVYIGYNGASFCTISVGDITEGASDMLYLTVTFSAPQTEAWKLGLNKFYDGDNGTIWYIYNWINASSVVLRGYDEDEFDGLESGDTITFFGALGNNSVCLGGATVAQNEYEVALGVKNASRVGSTPDAITIFSVGATGVGGSERTNAFEIRRDGKIYINNYLQKTLKEMVIDMQPCIITSGTVDDTTYDQQVIVVSAAVFAEAKAAFLAGRTVLIKDIDHISYSVVSYASDAVEDAAQTRGFEGLGIIGRSGARVSVNGPCTAVVAAAS